MPNLTKHLAQASAYATVFECLIDGPHTVFELQAESGLAPNTLRRLLRILKRRKRIYIAAWELDSQGSGRAVIAAYMWGSKPDVHRPRPKTSTERSAARRERQRLVSITQALTGISAMKMYKTVCVTPATDDTDKVYVEFASSADAASKARTRLKKEGMEAIKTEEVEVPTTRTELIAFLNGMLAHKSWVPGAVADKLTTP